MNVSVIGLGNLGMPIAKNLLKGGYAVTVHDLRPEAAAKLLALGATWADSPREAVEGAETVLTVLPSPTAVSAAAEGESGLIAGLAAEATWIDISTNDLHLVRRLAAEVEARGAHMLECPMTGGIPRAHEGTMAVFVGGRLEVFERNRPLLQVIGGEVLYLGPLGSASIAKVITNMLAFIHLWALGEGLMLGRKAGLHVGPLFEAIKASCGNSFVAETEGPEILNGSYDYGFTLALAAKDAGLAYQLGREHGVPLEMGGLVEQILARGRAKYGDHAWSTQIVKLLEDDLGLDLRAEGYETPRIER